MFIFCECLASKISLLHFGFEFLPFDFHLLNAFLFYHFHSFTCKVLNQGFFLWGAISQPSISWHPKFPFSPFYFHFSAFIFTFLLFTFTFLLFTFTFSPSFQVLNLGFFLWGAISQPSISSYLLYIFCANLALYTAYYITMKLVHKEKMTFQVVIISQKLLFQDTKGAKASYCAKCQVMMTMYSIAANHLHHTGFSLLAARSLLLRLQPCGKIMVLTTPIRLLYNRNDPKTQFEPF